MLLKIHYLSNVKPSSAAVARDDNSELKIKDFYRRENIDIIQTLAVWWTLLLLKYPRLSLIENPIDSKRNNASNSSLMEAMQALRHLLAFLKDAGAKAIFLIWLLISFLLSLPIITNYKRINTQIVSIFLDNSAASVSFILRHIGLENGKSRIHSVRASFHSKSLNFSSHCRDLSCQSTNLLFKEKRLSLSNQHLAQTCFGIPLREIPSNSFSLINAMHLSWLKRKQQEINAPCACEFSTQKLKSLWICKSSWWKFK